MPIGINPGREYYDVDSKQFISVPIPDVEKRGRGHGKIDDRKLHEFIKAGRTQAWIARYFKCSGAAVSKRIDMMKHNIVKEAAGIAPQIIAREIRTADQLCKINVTANTLLDSLYTTETVTDPLTGAEKTQMALKDPMLALRTMAEIRAQLKFQLEIFQTLTDAKAVKEFQDTVLETINSVSPELREAVVKALQRKNALRSALEFK